MDMIFRGSPDAEAGRRSHEQVLAASRRDGAPARLSARELKELCIAHGADDAGFVEVDRPGLADQAETARRLLPGARTLVAIVGTLNRDNLVAPPRSVANAGFHSDGARLTHAAHEIARTLRETGVRAVAQTVGFPMEVGRLPYGEPIWEIQHKIVAVEAGLGHMGIHRNVIHPKFGNFVMLDTVVIDAEVDAYGSPLDYNPCADCNLCIAVCPVGAISRKEPFDFFACMNHNYREFLFGFSDWVDSIAASDAAADYHTKFRDDETISMWQSLSSGPHYKSAYCMAVCPAGDDVIPMYLEDRRGFVETYLRPLKDQPEPVYVQSGTHAEKVAARNPAKDVRYVDFTVGLASVDNAIRGLQHMYDHRRSSAADGSSLRCVIAPDDEGAHEEAEFVLVVRKGGLQSVDATEVADPTATARGTLAVWMGVLTRAAGGQPTEAGGLEVSGDASALDAVLGALR